MFRLFILKWGLVKLISLSSQFVVFLFNDNLSVNITVVSRILVCCYFKWLSALGRSLYDGGIEVRILAPNKNFSIFYQIFQNLGLFCVYICHSRTCTCSNRKVTLKIVFLLVQFTSIELRGSNSWVYFSILVLFSLFKDEKREFICSHLCFRLCFEIKWMFGKLFVAPQPHCDIYLFLTTAATHTECCTLHIWCSTLDMNFFLEMCCFNIFCIS